MLIELKGYKLNMQVKTLLMNTIKLWVKSGVTLQRLTLTYYTQIYPSTRQMSMILLLQQLTQWKMKLYLEFTIQVIKVELIQWATCILQYRSLRITQELGTQPRKYREPNQHLKKGKCLLLVSMRNLECFLPYKVKNLKVVWPWLIVHLDRLYLLWE